LPLLPNSYQQHPSSSSSLCQRGFLQARLRRSISKGGECKCESRTCLVMHPPSKWILILLLSGNSKCSSFEATVKLCVAYIFIGGDSKEEMAIMLAKIASSSSCSCSLLTNSRQSDDLHCFQTT